MPEKNNYRKNRFRDNMNKDGGRDRHSIRNRNNAPGYGNRNGREGNFKDRDRHFSGDGRNDERRARFMKRAMGDVMDAYKTTAIDHSIIEAIKAYNEITKIRNTVYERLEEWYSAYFPNLKLNNHETYAKIISKVKNRDIDEELLKEIIGEEHQRVLEKIRTSEGFPEIDSEEYVALKNLAEEELSIIKLQDSLSAFLEIQTKKLMPNIVYLIDYKIAAEMLSAAGSLEHLAILPASTIQLLGAEKALFKHVKFGSKPPKYGYLFKLPELANYDKKAKGRMARAYATKISIAARADYYTKRFIADKLKESLLKNLKE
ncbi:MAG: hypothetical protein ACP5M9_00520 [Candidatus Micrarchaeia archaeon]